MKDHWLRQLERAIRKAEEQAVKDAGFEEDEVTVEHDEDYASVVQPIRFKARRQVVKDFLDEQNLLQREILNRYSRELKSEEDIWPREWMLQVKIRNNLNKKKNRLFIPLMNQLCKNTLPTPLCRKVMEDKRIPRYEVMVKDAKGQEEVHRYDYVLIKPLNDERRKQLAYELNTTVDPLYRYLREMVRLGIIKDLGRYNDDAPRIYAVGYWTTFQGNKLRPVYFLKNSPEMRDALREFDSSRKKFS